MVEVEPQLVELDLVGVRLGLLLALEHHTPLRLRHNQCHRRCARPSVRTLIQSESDRVKIRGLEPRGGEH